MQGHEEALRRRDHSVSAISLSFLLPDLPLKKEDLGANEEVQEKLFSNYC